VHWHHAQHQMANLAPKQASPVHAQPLPAAKVGVNV